MNDLTILNGLLVLINVALTGIGVKIFSELVKWKVLNKRN